MDGTKGDDISKVAIVLTGTQTKCQKYTKVFKVEESTISPPPFVTKYNSISRFHFHVQAQLPSDIFHFLRYDQLGMGQMPGMDSGEKRLNELGYKQELRREMVILCSIFPATLFLVSLHNVLVSSYIFSSSLLFDYMKSSTFSC